MLDNISSWYINLIEINHEFDFYFFVHTYNLSESDILNINSKLPNCTVISEIDNFLTHSIDIEKLKIILNLNRLTNIDRSLEMVTNFDNFLFMLRKIYLCNLLSQNSNINFEYSIRMRPDLFFHKNIKIPKLQNFILLNNDPWENCSHDMRIFGKVLNDQFAIGDTDSINHYCNLYNNVIKYCEDGNIFHPESQLYRHLIGFNLIKQDLFFEINRI